MAPIEYTPWRWFMSHEAHKSMFREYLKTRKGEPKSHGPSPTN